MRKQESARRQRGKAVTAAAAAAAAGARTYIQKSKTGRFQALLRDIPRLAGYLSFSFVREKEDDAKRRRAAATATPLLPPPVRVSDFDISPCARVPALSSRRDAPPCTAVLSLGFV